MAHYGFVVIVVVVVVVVFKNAFRLQLFKELITLSSG